MTRWKMVPSFLTPEMWAAGARTKGLEASYEAMLAAAPAFEPDDAMVRRAVGVLLAVSERPMTMEERMSAALKAAFEEGK